MPLVTCKDCGNQCSNRAAACPKCGGPIAKAAIARIDLRDSATVYPLLFLVGAYIALRLSFPLWGITIMAIAAALLALRVIAYAKAG